MCDLKRTLDATVCLQPKSSDPVYLNNFRVIVYWRCRQELARPSRFSLSLCLTNRFAHSRSSFLVALTCLMLKFYPVKRKLIYCARTVPEIEKALAELKGLMAYRVANAETPESAAQERAFTGLGLTSRKNLCIHPEVYIFSGHLPMLLTHGRSQKRRRAA
jgi:hypothetical protein